MKQLLSQLDQLDIRRLPELAASLFAGLMLGFFPLALITGYGSLTRDKFLLLAVMCCDLALAELLALWWNRRFHDPLTLLHRFSAPQRLLLLFWLLALVSAALSPYPDLVLLGGGRWNGLLALSLMIFLALVLASLGRWHDWYFYLTALSALLMAGLCLWQLSGGNPLGLYPPGMSYADGGRQYQGRFLGTIGNVDMLSAYWCLALPLLLGGTLLGQGRGRLLPAAALLLGLGVELAADVDSGALALGLSALVMLPWLLPQGRRRWAWLAACLLLAAALARLYFYSGPAQGTLWELSRVLHGEVRAEFGSSRVLIWQEAWASMDSLREWLLGSGPGARSTHFSTVFERVSDSGLTLKAAVDSSHNEYLDLLLELGGIGLAVYAAALLATAAGAVRALRSGDRRALFLAWSLLAYCLQAMFNFSSVVITPLFWAVWGLLLARLKGGAPPLFLSERTDTAATVP